MTHRHMMFFTKRTIRFGLLHVPFALFQVIHSTHSHARYIVDNVSRDGVHKTTLGRTWSSGRVMGGEYGCSAGQMILD